MSILQYKYKAHKLVNTLFYVIVFVIGFVLGFGAKEIDFSKLISQVLMIDSVSAYTMYEDENVSIDKQFIENKFIEFFGEEIDFNVHKNYIASKQGNVISFLLLDDNTLNNLYINSKYSNDSRYMIGYNPIPDSIIYNFNYYPSTNSYYHQKIFTDNGSDNLTTIYRVDTDDYFSRTNFDLSFATDEDNNLINQLNLEFNENLFKDNPDFKEVCVPNNAEFAISTNNYELNENEDSEYYNSKSFSSYEFIWFPYFPKGLVSYLYDNTKENNVWILEEDETYFEMHPLFHYWLNSKEGIDEIYNKEDPGSFLNSLGYADKYSYYGWYFHPFVVKYADAGLRQFSIFSFKNNIEVVNLNNEISTDYENYCFYIRNDFDITILNTDEFGDQYGDIVIMGDEILHISTSHNAANLDSKGLFEKVKVFLNKMTNPINFVKDYIYELYESMPMLLKLFIISVFGLVVIKILIGMVVK
ncbi:MAG: hypothetical protein IJY25_03115 [Bacilli bacterium]|nr:hypothetical protein [Bacilli bacterium]